MVAVVVCKGSRRIAAGSSHEWDAARPLAGRCKCCLRGLLGAARFFVGRLDERGGVLATGSARQGSDEECPGTDTVLRAGLACKVG